MQHEVLYQRGRLLIVRNREQGVTLLIDGVPAGTYQAEHNARRVAAIWLALWGDQRESSLLARALPLRRPVPWLVPWE
jgi:hypothetical protein